MSENINGVFDAMKPTEAQKESIYNGILSRAMSGASEARPRRRYAGRPFALPAAAIALCLVMTATAFAAWQFLKPADVAEHAGAASILEAFRGENTIEMGITKSDGDLEITLLGVALGDEMKMYAREFAGGEGFGALGAEMYAVLAVTSADGLPVSAEDIRISSLIKSPEQILWQISPEVSIEGSFAEDNVLYIAAGVEAMGDFLLVSDTDDLQGAFDYDDYTFELTPNAEYDGINTVFRIPRGNFSVEGGAYSLAPAEERDEEPWKANYDYCMNIPLEECELVPDSVKTVTDGYEYQGEGWFIGGGVGGPAEYMEFDADGVFRSGIVGDNGGTLIIVFKRGEDGTVTGMLYRAPE
jgi:hypothetical protein